ncbi:hypothetical protein MAMMFC1_01346 [Methylomusa anaerophila]|uniref:Uncharacterized protein n=1 Tax=Methylomusa anaerophila TaxID=1930071 RepID=A0A348AHY7_9FIRM|nr:hypothetical protein MAMMFC1_01346 [Methylomusa anaerophila]
MDNTFVPRSYFCLNYLSKFSDPNNNNEEFIQLLTHIDNINDNIENINDNINTVNNVRRSYYTGVESNISGQTRKILFL